MSNERRCAGTEDTEAGNADQADQRMVEFRRSRGEFEPGCKQRTVRLEITEYESGPDKLRVTTEIRYYEGDPPQDIGKS